MEEVFVGNNTQTSRLNDNSLDFVKLPEQYFVSKETGRQMVGLEN